MENQIVQSLAPESLAAPSLLSNRNALYWGTLISACCIGETLGDYISHGLSLGYGLGSLLLLAIFGVVVILELRSQTPSRLRYWTAIPVTSTTGTTLADFTSRTLHLGYSLSTCLLVATLASCLLLWRWSLRPAAASSLDDREPAGVPSRQKGSLLTEVFFWLSFLVVSTFGTTLGDYVTDNMALGPRNASLALATVLLLVLACHLAFSSRSRTLYWTALVLTSTVGATTGDFLTKEDGLNLGYAVGTTTLMVPFLALLLLGAILPYRGTSGARRSWLTL